MPWLQLRIVTSRDDVPKVERALEHHCALSITLEDNADQPIFEPGIGETPLWEDTRVTALFDADVDTNAIGSAICKKLGLTHEQTHWHVLEDKDWEREWMKDYRPIQCSDNFWICPSWLEPEAPEAVNLILDPGLAFGTGTHPTTFLCLQWLSRQNVKGASVIDYGCGSGILGVASLLLGSKRVIGVDIDPQALVATKENTKRNQLNPDDFAVYFPSKAPSEAADLVLANILAGPLVELADTLSNLIKPGGQICLSGVLVSQKNDIIKAYSSYIEFDDISEKDEWACLAGRRI